MSLEHFLFWAEDRIEEQARTTSATSTHAKSLILGSFLDHSWIILGLFLDQDRIEEQASVVADLIVDQGAHICVCGDGRAMASDVHESLVNALTDARSVVVVADGVVVVAGA